MWLLIVCDEDNYDCKVHTFGTNSEAMEFLRVKVEKLWKDCRDDFDTGAYATVLARRNLWTLDEMKDWLKGENNINTIHLKRI